MVAPKSFSVSTIQTRKKLPVSFACALARTSLSASSSYRLAWATYRRRKCPMVRSWICTHWKRDNEDIFIVFYIFVGKTPSSGLGIQNGNDLLMVRSFSGRFWKFSTEAGYRDRTKSPTEIRCVAVRLTKE